MTTENKNTAEMRALHPWHGYMTNFDHTIEDGFEALLRADPGEVYGIHSAVNFNGRVWFADGQFTEEVWRYGGGDRHRNRRFSRRTDGRRQRQIWVGIDD